MSDQSGQAITMSRCRAALVLVRTFLGIVYLTNGLAKLFEFHTVVLGPWKTFLIDRGDAFGIQQGNTNSSPGLLHDIGVVIVANWGNFQFVLTFAELAVGLGLLFGFLSRLTILGGFLLSFSTFIFTLGAETWMFDYLFEPVLFLTLAIGPPLPGLDSRMPWSRPRSQQLQP